MKTYDECQVELVKKHQREKDAFIKIQEIYSFAEKLVRAYEQEFESGSATLNYNFGYQYVTITLKADFGKHPLKEALILIDEIIYPEEDWLKEVKTPRELSDYLFWRFEAQEGVFLCLDVVMQESGGCRQVGTGKYQEVMEWRCD